MVSPPHEPPSEAALRFCKIAPTELKEREESFEGRKVAIKLAPVLLPPPTVKFLHNGAAGRTDGQTGQREGERGAKMNWKQVHESRRESICGAREEGRDHTSAQTTSS